MISRVVLPEVTILSISDGDTITVKQRLNAGEERRMITRGVTYLPDGSRHVDLVQAGLAKVLAYLVDWSLIGLDSRVIPIAGESAAIVEAALDTLDGETYTEILRAIEAHEVAMAAARDAQKKIRSGGPRSSATSPSLVGVGGATSG